MAAKPLTKMQAATVPLDDPIMGEVAIERREVVARVPYRNGGMNAPGDVTVVVAAFVRCGELLDEECQADEGVVRELSFTFGGYDFRASARPEATR